MSTGLKFELKEFSAYYKGCTLKCKAQALMREFRYAWQRAWRGWDDADVFNAYNYFRENYIGILRDFEENRHCLFNVPEEYRDVYDKDFFTDEETKAIIETMIHHLELMDEDYVEKVLYGKNVHDEDYEVPADYADRCKRINMIMMQNKNAFMKLFFLFFYQLWD